MKKTYTKKDPIEHILLRSSMYVGSKTLKTYSDYVADVDEETSMYRISQKTVTASPAILRIFIEILSNAVDNVKRSKDAGIVCTAIKVKIDKTTGETSVWNDGDIIPVEVHPEEKIYNHSLIFGHLLTGSNYDDDIEREISGCNGLGAKIVCVFSKQFKVRGLDPTNKKIFEQTWTENMKATSPPTIKKTAKDKGYTEVTYTPDFEKFELEGYTDDIIGLYLKYVIDAAMLTSVKVYFNDKLVNVSNLTAYAKLYNVPGDPTDVLCVSHENVDAVIMPSHEFKHVSFTNGIYTRLGGQHVEAVCEAVFRPLVEKFKKKGALKISDIKQFFKIFVKCVVPNPEFDSQSKERLESPKVKFEVNQTALKKIMKWSVIADIEDMLKAKDMVALKKTEKKKKGYVKIDGYDPANNAGGKYSTDCSLILCEGLSAKTYAVAGIVKGVGDKVGRDWFGIMSLTGKILNCRNASPTVLAKNTVIVNLMCAIGLKLDVDYKLDENFKTLNYGKIILLTDADSDGGHISGLVMNFIHCLYPSILDRPEPYIVSMATPIVRVFNPKGDKLFYDENRFRQFAKAQTEKFKSKYYKGLGTTKIEDVPDTFGKKMVRYHRDDSTADTMNKVFHKSLADQRKTWIENFNPCPAYSLDDQGPLADMSYSDYLNFEVIKFSHDDCKRSIPNLFDGLKQSQRKVLYAVKKRKLYHTKPSLKVAQLGGYVAEHSNYHHGEQNLYDTIIKLAQSFPGSNNIPLLYRDGAFGTRLSNGKDAASPRYIFTKMESITPLLFREEDDVLLEYVEDDGDIVEPKYYVPILPMVLVNGALGIGSGWSSTIPSFNPLDVMKCVRNWIEGNPTGAEDLVPWYRGYIGEIKKDDKKFISHGKIDRVAKKVVITEIPIGMSIDKFKEMCEDWIVEKKIKGMKNNSSYKKIEFILTEDPDGFLCNMNNLKLTCNIQTTNMVLFDEDECIKKYTTSQIIDDFCKMRLGLYTKRKQSQIKQIELDLLLVKNKARFIHEVTSNKIQIMNVREEEIVQTLEATGYWKTHDDQGDKHGYGYLLRLQVKSFTSEKVKQLNEDIVVLETKLEAIKSKSEQEMWKQDLNEFESEYSKWVKKLV